MPNPPWDLIANMQLSSFLTNDCSGGGPSSCHGCDQHFPAYIVVHATETAIKTASILQSCCEKDDATCTFLYQKCHQYGSFHEHMFQKGQAKKKKPCHTALVSVVRVNYPGADILSTKEKQQEHHTTQLSCVLSGFTTQAPTFSASSTNSSLAACGKKSS
jgi:hypothetical protein